MQYVLDRIYTITEAISKGETISKADEDFIIGIESTFIDALNHIDYINEVLKNKEESQKANA